MAELGRVLRDVGKTVTGVLGAVLGEGSGAAARPAPAADEAQTGTPPAADAAAPEPAEDAPVTPTPDDDLAAQTAAALTPAAAAVTPADTAAPATEEPAEPAAPADPAGQEPVAQEPTAQEPVAQEPTAQEPTAEAEAVPQDQPVSPEPEAPRDPDPVLAAAVDLAREAAVEVGGSAVGEHLSATADGPADQGPVVTHAFATTDPAYVGWRWAVTLARADDTSAPTVDEVVLLPGDGALLAPAWVPWSERVESGDLAAGDVLPPAPDDPRLVPSYADPESDADAALADAVRWELGLGRPRVLSREGRELAAERWWEGEQGPDTPRARQAPGQCADCGFLVPLAGGLRLAFGVCANAVAPDDGRVVALAHGCGAHSETVVESPHAATAGLRVEDDEFELVPTGADAG